MKPAFCDIVAELDMEDVIRLLDVLKNMDSFTGTDKEGES